MAPSRSRNDGPSAKQLAQELGRLRKRIERAEKKTADLKQMVYALETLLDDATG